MIHNVTAYGARGDGKSDDRDEIAAATRAAGRAGGIYFPAGTYRIASDLTIPSSSTFAPGARLSPDAGRTVTIDGSLVTGLTQIFTGRGVIKFGEGRIAEVFPQWWGARDDQGASTDSTRAIQSALDALGIWGGRVAIPQGRYIVTSAITLPPDSTDGRTIEIVGYGEAVLHNRSPRDNPTFRLLGTADRKMHGVKIRNLVFTGEAGFPNHGVHWRFVVQSLIEDCTFNCHGNAVYIDGGVFGLVFRNVHVWPSGRKHRAPTAHVGSAGILFDAPKLDAGFAHTITIDDLVVESGGRGVELRPGYNAFAWRIGRVLAEGLAGPDGWGLDLYHLRSSHIGPLYTEHNTDGRLGDASDLVLRMRECTRTTVTGIDGSGLISVRDCSDVVFQGITCNAFDADATNTRLTIIGLQVSIVGGAAAGYRNQSTDRVEVGVIGAGTTSLAKRIDGRQMRGTAVESGIGPHDDVRAKNSAIRWEDDAGTGAAQRIQHLVSVLADNGDWDLRTAGAAVLFVNTTRGEFAQLAIHGVRNAASLIADPAGLFSVAAGRAGSINVYFDARTGSYHLQNKTGDQREVVIFALAAS